MTSSNSNGPRLPRWLVEYGLNTWDILRAARYGEMRQESEKKIRRKIEDKKTIQEIEESVNEFKEKNNKIIQEIKKSVNKIEKSVNEFKEKSNKTIQETEESIRKTKEDLEESITETIRQQVYNIKAYKSMESELRKLQAGVILIPVFLVAFSVFFGDRIKDIMSIDVLQAEIKSLQEDVKSLQSTQGKGAYPHGLPPWDESQSHCSDGGIFPDC